MRISPDGKQIAFAEHPIFGDDRGFVALVQTDATVRRISAEYGTVNELTWNADGSEVWFSAIQTGEDSGFSWSNDGSRAIFTGSEDDQGIRGYLLEFPAGTVRAVTPTDTQIAILSPDGDSVLDLNADHSASIRNIADGTVIPVAGLQPNEYPIQWHESGSIFVWDRSFPARAA